MSDHGYFSESGRDDGARRFAAGYRQGVEDEARRATRRLRRAEAKAREAGRREGLLAATGTELREWTLREDPMAHPRTIVARGPALGWAEKVRVREIPSDGTGS